MSNNALKTFSIHYHFCGEFAGDLIVDAADQAAARAKFAKQIPDADMYEISSVKEVADEITTEQAKARHRARKGVAAE